MQACTVNNINSVRRQIYNKINYNVPFYATLEDMSTTVSDMDHFPYKRFFRSKYNVATPIIFEREAGFHPLNNFCYKEKVNTQIFNPTYCWQNSCTTVLPCGGKQQDKNFVISP